MAEAIHLNIDGIAPALSLYTHDRRDQIISKRIKESGIWEAYETALTVKLLNAGDIYVDAGANIGYYSLIASRKVGSSGQVFAYEPDPDNLAVLQQNISLNQADNIHTFALALSDKQQQGQLYLSEDNFGDHRIYDDAGRQSKNIELVNGSEHLSALTGHIDFIKVDTQGAEYLVLKGLYPLIKANQAHLKMIVEICPFGIRHAGAHGLDLLALLDSLEMQYHYIDHINHQLIGKTSEDLQAWIKELDDYPDNEGFINLLITAKGFSTEGL